MADAVFAQLCAIKQEEDRTSGLLLRNKSGVMRQRTLRAHDHEEAVHYAGTGGQRASQRKLTTKRAARESSPQRKQPPAYPVWVHPTRVMERAIPAYEAERDAFCFRFFASSIPPLADAAAALTDRPKSSATVSTMPAVDIGVTLADAPPPPWSARAATRPQNKRLNPLGSKHAHGSDGGAAPPAAAGGLGGGGPSSSLYSPLPKPPDFISLRVAPVPRIRTPRGAAGARGGVSPLRVYDGVHSHSPTSRLSSPASVIPPASPPNLAPTAAPGPAAAVASCYFSPPTTPAAKVSAAPRHTSPYGDM